MENDVKVFKSPLFGDVRTSGTSDSPLFCLADVCKALGLTNPRVVKQRLNGRGVSSTYAPAEREVTTNNPPQKRDVHTTDTPSMRGVDSTDTPHVRGVITIDTPTLNQHGAVVMQQMTFIDEANLYRCIFQSRKKEAEAFQDWVTGEVLPAIRRTGRYGRDVLANSRHRELLLGLHDMLEARDKQVQLLEEFLEARDREVHDLTHRLEQLTPGSRFAEAVKTSEQSILIGDLARILRANGVDTGQTRLFQWMRDNGYLIKRQGESYNQPTIRALEMGLFEIKKTVVTRADGTSLVTTTPKVTGKGQVYFVDKMSGTDGPNMPDNGVIRKIGCAGVV